MTVWACMLVVDGHEELVGLYSTRDRAVERACVRGPMPSLEEWYEVRAYDLDPPLPTDGLRRYNPYQR